MVSPDLSKVLKEIGKFSHPWILKGLCDPWGGGGLWRALDLKCAREVTFVNSKLSSVVNSKRFDMKINDIAIPARWEIEGVPTSEARVIPTSSA